MEYQKDVFCWLLLICFNLLNHLRDYTHRTGMYNILTLYNIFVFHSSLYRFEPG